MNVRNQGSSQVIEWRFTSGREGKNKITFDECIGCFNNVMINTAAVYIYFAFGLKCLNEIKIKN